MRKEVSFIGAEEKILKNDDIKKEYFFLQRKIDLKVLYILNIYVKCI